MPEWSNKFKYVGRCGPMPDFSGVHYSDVSQIKSVKRVTSDHHSRMANALHRSQTCLWRARNQSFLTAVFGKRWMSNFKSQSPLSDIEVPTILSPHIVLMPVPEHSTEG